jgi:hypothetical protein
LQHSLTGDKLTKVPKGYIRPVYDSSLWAEIKFLFVDKGFSAVQISKQYGGKPTYQAVQNRAKKKDPATGFSWMDERGQREKDKYLKLSPQSQASQLMDAVDSIIVMLTNKLKRGSTDAKEISTVADSLAKVNKTLEKIVDKKFQVPMLYEFLETFVNFLLLHYKTIITPEFINAVKHFKNETRKKLEYN